MKHKTRHLGFAAVAVAFLAALLTTACSDTSGTKPDREKTDAPQSGDKKGQRIVSLAPSITEILFALNLGPQVVGDTKFCDYPPAAENKSKIGGYYDVNYEAIVALEPDVVILLEEHSKARRHLKKLDINTLQVNNQTVNGILDTITTIGKRCDRTQKAKELVTNLRRRMKNIREKTAGRRKPKALVCIGRNMGTQGLKDVYVAGRDGFYSRLVQLAGGKNAYSGTKVAFPKISQEGLLTLNPEVILDMAADLKESDNVTKADVVREWQKLEEIKAVKNDRVHVLTADYVTVPGPRFIHLLEKMARALHPEAGWKK